MDFTRRELLKYSTTGFLTALAGCGEQGEVSNPTDDETDTPQVTTATATPTTTATETATPTSTPQQTVAELGETLVYTEGSKELEFTVSQASLHDALIRARSGRLYSTVPKNADHTFLTLKIDVTNTGNERILTPHSTVLRMQGRQYERTYQTYQETYRGSTELLPGSSMTGWAVFAIPPAESQARLIVDFARFGEAVTGEWRFDLASLDREQYDYLDRQPGDLLVFGTEEIKYQIGAVRYEETGSYTYSSNGYQFTEEAGQGNKFVLVSVYARNSGERTVSLPGTYSMSLLAGSSQYDAGYYRGTGGYEGGEVAPSVEREGVVQFEVPRSAVEYELRVNLTSEITASWNL